MSKYCVKGKALSVEYQYAILIFTLENIILPLNIDVRSVSVSSMLISIT